MCTHEAVVSVDCQYIADFCRSVEQVVPPPDIPAALMFYTSSATVPPTLAVGTNRGTVLLVKPDLTVVSLNQRYMEICAHFKSTILPSTWHDLLCCRVSKQQEVYPSLFDSTGYNCCKIVTFASCPLSSLVRHSLGQTWYPFSPISPPKRWYQSIQMGQ